MSWFSELSKGNFWLKGLLYLKDVHLTSSNEHLYRAIRFLQKSNVLSEPVTIADVGSHTGETLLFWHKHFPSATIIGFEPNPDSHARAVENTKHISSIKIHPYALSSKEGSADLNVTQNSVSSSLNAPSEDLFGKVSSGYRSDLEVVKQVSVSTNTLDSFGLKSLTLLKLDAQGHEIEILHGASETLKSTRIVVTEMSVQPLYSGGAAYHETDAVLRNAGFSLLDVLVPARKNGVETVEFDAIYVNRKLFS